MAHNTTPLSYRIPTPVYEKIEEITNRKGTKVGTWLREVIPFIVNYPELFSQEHSVLGKIHELIRNRERLIDYDGLTLSRADLENEGFDFGLYTGSKMSVDGFPTIFILDYSIDVKKEMCTIKKIDNGSL